MAKAKKMEVENKVREPEANLDVNSEESGAQSGVKRGGLPVQDVQRYIYYVVFLVIVGLFYIWNSHVAEQQVRKENHLEKEIADVNAEYKTVHARLDAGTREPVIIKKVDSLGLKSSSNNTFKLTRE
ncbi:MAG TPA: hypothetical protein ENJ82_00950 [Bacteroidetes bacterium]|nr:hypothetical protein [Bacteroidota bacterium]